MNTSLWLDKYIIEDLLSKIYLALLTAKAFDKEVLDNIVNELEVAHAREKVSRIKFPLIAFALGKSRSAIPVRLNNEEIKVLSQYVELPPSFNTIF